jgi:hypothetical protein
MRPKGIVVFGVIFIFMSLFCVYGVISGLYRLPHYVITDKGTLVLNLIYSFIFIIGYLYAGINILNLKYSGVYAGYFMSLLAIFDEIRRIFLYKFEGISVARLVGHITGFATVFLLYLLLFIIMIRYFRNPAVRKYFGSQ